MFTTLSTQALKRRTLCERLHLSKKHRFLSERISYGGTEFYTTRLLSYAKDNQNAIKRFAANINMPIISDKSEITEHYRLILLGRTLCSRSNLPDSVGLFDPHGRLLPLLPIIAPKFRVIYVYTTAVSYADAAQKVFESTGTPVIFGDSLKTISGCKITLAKGAPPISLSPYTILTDTTRSILLPEYLKRLLPDYVNPLCAFAGLYFSGHRELGRLQFDKI